MPFVTQDHRDNPDFGIPGDRCYVSYESMVSRWKKEPRWTTADKIYTDLEGYKEYCKSTRIEKNEPCKHCIAADLAWQVFFQLHVMPYEVHKQWENGDI